MSNVPELLAPAGSPACALAAFAAGADAVYAGLAKFNARERGENFDPETMMKVVDFAHRSGKKVYLTFNTLIKEQELPEVAELLDTIRAIGPDALLVQDLGTLRIIREYFPSLELHASTQMGFHNSSGFAVAEKLGVSREHLSKTFRQETGITLRDYRAGLRLEEACSMLLKTDLSCKEIAVLCHYGSYSAFFRAFRKVHGVSPEKFREGGISK